MRARARHLHTHDPHAHTHIYLVPKAANTKSSPCEQQRHRTGTSRSHTSNIEPERLA